MRKTDQIYITYIAYYRLSCLGRTPLLSASRNARYDVIEHLLQVDKFKLLFVVYISIRGRRHGFESGGDKFCERSEQKVFLTPHFLASGGQNIT